MGVGKAGTTSLYAYLKQVPGVYMSPVKEAYFYIRNLKSPVDPIITDRAEYVALFDGVTDEIAIGEASPGYYWDPLTPELIKADVPDAKIIILLRDPVERAFSAWYSRVRTGLEKRTFSTAIRDQIESDPLPYDNGFRYVYNGVYAEPLKRYLETFDKIKIMIFEEFVKDPPTSVRDVLDFLGVEHADVQEIDYNARNSAEMPEYRKGAKRIIRSRISHLVPKRYRRSLTHKFLFQTRHKPSMRAQDRTLLEEFYEPTVREVEKILGRNLPWKKASKEITDTDAQENSLIESKPTV